MSIRKTVRVTALSMATFLLVCGISRAAQTAAPAEQPETREQRLEAARERLEQAAREVAELSLDGRGMRNIMRFEARGAGRAALGINIANRAEGTADDGVPVVSVSPGGPAEAAGIRAGDVLLSLDGKPLKRENGRSPQAALLAFMDDIEPGTTLAVEYRRDGKTSKVNVIAQPLAPRFIAGTSGMPMPGNVMSFGDGAGPAFTVFRGPDVFGDIELVSLTPKLGQYFGTDKGLLVVRASGDASLTLEEGDVVLDIAGRVPTSPAHAMRILGSYQPGEKLTFNIMRLKKKVPLSVEIPAAARRGNVMFEGPGVQTAPGSPGGGVLFNMPVPPPVIQPLPPGADDRA